MEQLVSLLNLAPAKTDKPGPSSPKTLPKEGEETFKTTLDEAFQTIETHGKNGTEITAKAVVSSRFAKENLAEEKEIRDIKSIKDIKDIIRLSSEKKLNLKSLTVEIHQEGGSDKKLVIKRGDETEKSSPKIVLTASPKASLAKEKSAVDTKSSIDLKELIARLDKEKEVKENKVSQNNEPRDKKEMQQVKSPTPNHIETKASETKHSEQIKYAADTKSLSDTEDSVKENGPAPKRPRQVMTSLQTDSEKTASNALKTEKIETAPIDKVPLETKPSSKKQTPLKERTLEQKVQPDTSRETKIQLPDDPSLQEEEAHRKPLLKKAPLETRGKTDKQEKLPQDTVQGPQQQKNSLKQVTNNTIEPLQEKNETPEKIQKPVIHRHESKKSTPEENPLPNVKKSENKTTPPLQAKKASETEADPTPAQTKPLKTDEKPQQMPKEAPRPLQQAHTELSSKTTETLPVSNASVKSVKEESTPVRSQKPDLAELLRKQLSTKQMPKAVPSPEGAEIKTKTAKTTPAATSSSTPKADSQPPIEEKTMETRAAQAADTPKKMPKEAITAKALNTVSPEPVDDEKALQALLDEKRTDSKETKTDTPLKSVQKVQTTTSSASLNALIASKKAESKETKKTHAAKSDSDIRPMQFQQTAAQGVNEMPQASRDLISKMVSKNISSIAAGTIKSDALFDDTVQKAKTGMETALESISQNEETGDDTVRDVVKPDDVKTDSVKSRITAARATVNHFVNDLKERIENYKAPLMKITLDLNPKNLGSVGVTLLNRGKNLHVQIHSNSQAIQLFMQNNADFKNALNDLGYRDVQLGFSSGQGSSAGHDGGRGGYREQDPSYYEGQTRDQADGSSEEMEIILPNIVYG